MDSNKDEVNVSIEETVEKKAAPKKRGPKKGAVKASPKKVSAKSDSSKKKEKDKNKKGVGIVSFLIAILVTATIVGGGVYYWQRGENEGVLDKIKKDARNARLDFEQRIDSIKEKLSSKEKEVDELTNVKKDLEEKSKLLDVAKIDYKNNELSFRFQYPVSFGEVKLEKIEGDSGVKFIGTFTENEELYFGGISKDYLAATTTNASSSVVGFVDSFGFTKEGDKYFYQTVGEESKDHRIEPMRTVNSDLGGVVLLNKDSFVKDEEGNIWDFGLGHDIGAITNIKNSKFDGGLVFVNKNTAKFPLVDFEDTLRSIR